MINRQDIIRKAIDECYNEMYKWAQPSIDLEEYIKNPELRKESELLLAVGRQMCLNR